MTNEKDKVHGYLLANLFYTSQLLYKIKEMVIKYNTLHGEINLMLVFT